MVCKNWDHETGPRGNDTDHLILRAEWCVGLGGEKLFSDRGSASLQTPDYICTNPALKKRSKVRPPTWLRSASSHCPVILTAAFLSLAAIFEANQLASYIKSPLQTNLARCHFFTFYSSPVLLKPVYLPLSLVMFAPCVMPCCKP